MAAPQEVIGPPGSGAFGSKLVVLPNGNFVVTDPYFDQQAPVISDVGAVYLYDSSGKLISRLTGSTANDRVGDGDVTVLANGNFVIRSIAWQSRGALTWGSATSGVSGVVSRTNSLIGENEGYLSSIVTLRNGNYVVRSPHWNFRGGAITWCNGTTGEPVGEISAINSLVGSNSSNQIAGSIEQPNPIVELSNGNFVVASLSGAVTWVNGMNGITGQISSKTSLIGSYVGERVVALPNGNYVVLSPWWGTTDRPRTGAVTWGNGSTGSTGLVSSANSLVGNEPYDEIGQVITLLTNGNYVISSTKWRSDSGAVTWGSGIAATVGVVSESNSYVGEPGDLVGYVPPSFSSETGVIALSNGNYVIRSTRWRSVGAITWGNGTTGSSGLISSANSFVGSTAGDMADSKNVVALSNGNFVFAAPSWDSPTVQNAGAVLWGNGNTGGSGPISAANALVGMQQGDAIGGATGSVVALKNGNYIVTSPNWSSPTRAALGAITWGNGLQGTFGTVAASNSAIGSSQYDLFWSSVIPLSTGNYLVRMPDWRDSSAGMSKVGAIYWGNGQGGTFGDVNAGNSLLGASENELGSVVPLPNGNYLVTTPKYDASQVLPDVGAVSWGSGHSASLVGRISNTNSLIGTQANQLLGQATTLTILANGNYLLPLPTWNGFGLRVGALSWGSANHATTGGVSQINSLVGSATDDLMGMQVFQGESGRYVVVNKLWDDALVRDAGAVTFAGSSGVRGVIGVNNSILGSNALQAVLNVVFDPRSERLFMVRAGNIVSIFKGPDFAMLTSGFE